MKGKEGHREKVEKHWSRLLRTEAPQAMAERKS
jgi:hypothetical protein